MFEENIETFWIYLYGPERELKKKLIVILLVVSSYGTGLGG